MCGGSWNFGQIFQSATHKGKLAWLITTTGGPEAAYQVGQMHDMTLDDRLHHVTWGTFAFCGFNVLPTFKGWAPFSAG